jgi:hypothetical protein
MNKVPKKNPNNPQKQKHNIPELDTYAERKVHIPYQSRTYFYIKKKFI